MSPIDAWRPLRRGWSSPDPKWSEDQVDESWRDPRTEALAERLEATERFARAFAEYAAVDPETGRAWLVDTSGHMQGNSGCLRMRPLSPERAAALRADPTLLERSQTLYRIDWPIDVLVGGHRSADETGALLRRLEATSSPEGDRRDGFRTLVDPTTGWPWIVDRGGAKEGERPVLRREVDDHVIVGEDGRHAKIADYIDGLDGPATSVPNGDDRSIIRTDPDTGWAWTVTEAVGPYGEPARRLRSIPPAPFPSRRTPNP